MEENEKAEKSSMSSDERIESLQNHLDHREKKLKELSIFLGDINNDLNNAIKKYQDLFHEKAVILHKLERKNDQVMQEKSDKKWIEDHILKLEKENIRLKEILNQKKKEDEYKKNSDIQKTYEKTNFTNEESQYQPPIFQ